MSVLTVLKSIARSIFFIINIAAIAWLAICKWASLHNVSQSPSYLSMVSYTCFFAALLNIFFIIFWLFSKKRKWLSIFSLIALIGCWSVVYPTYGLHPFTGKPENENAPGIKVMTWNVHLFDLGEWTRDKASRQKIIDFIKTESPDILCLQEFYMDSATNGEPYTNVIRQLGYPYFEFSPESVVSKSVITSNAQKGDKIAIGHAVFSKYPLQNPIRYPLSTYHYNMLSVDVHVDTNQTFNLNVVHLSSVRFGADDITYLQDLKEKGTQVEENEKSKSIIIRLKKAFSERAKQANKIDSLKDETDYPIIICGDFNDVPSSYVYTKIKNGLSDPFTAKAFGFCRTYRNIMPTLRIDYIFYDPDALSPETYRSPDLQLSDHLPVIVDFSLRVKNKE